MTLTNEQGLALLYLRGKPNITTRVFMRCDVRGTLTTALNNATTTTFVIDAVVSAQVQVGDILQVGSEDMLVKSKNGVTVTVERQYAGTQWRSPGWPANAALWVWRDFTARPGFEHGIIPPARVKTSLEKSLYRYETSIGDLEAQNGDRFWDRVTLENGFASYQYHWLRIYTNAAGGHRDDLRAVATVLFDDVRTDSTTRAKIKTVGLGYLLKALFSEELANGRELYAYMPTWYLVQMLLEAVDQFRSDGTNADGVGLPVHWRWDISSTAGRQIPLPNGKKTISHFGRFNEFAWSQTNSTPPTRETRDTSVGNLGAGLFCTAICYDPQVTPANAITSGTNTGRIYAGISNEIWEFNPATGRGAKRVTSLVSSALRIRRLWYNPLDTAIAAGKPHLCGAMWMDRPASSSNTGYNQRVEGNAADATENMRLFSFDGTTYLFSRSVTKAFAGTHCFRDGSAGGILGTYISGGPFSENVSLPFRQKIYADTTAGRVSLASQIRQNSGSGGFNPPYRSDPEFFDTQEPTPGAITANLNLDAEGWEPNIGIVEETLIEEDEASAVAPERVEMSHFGVSGLGASTGHLRFTMGQQGAVAFCGTIGNLGGTKLQNGGIAYWTMDTATGILSLNLWKIVDGSNAVLLTLASKDEQPYCMAGWIDPTGSNVLAYGSVTWTAAAADSTAQLYGVTAAGVRASLLTVANLTAYWTPLWMGIVRNGNTGYVVCSLFNRNQNADSPSFRNYALIRLTIGTTVAFSATNLRSSLIHAITPFGTAGLAWAIDCAGHLIQIDATTGASMTITALDSAYPPVDGEHWSACEQLAAVDATTVYGVSAPVFPYNDVRGGATEGLFVAWQHGTTITDVLEIAEFRGKPIEKCLAELAFCARTYWGFNARGDFIWKDRVQTATPKITLDRRMGDATFWKERGYNDVQNVVEIVPSAMEWGQIKWDMHLTNESTIKSRDLIEVTVTTKSRKQVNLRCIQAGRPGVAKFAYMTLDGSLTARLSQSKIAGSYASVTITPTFASASGPYSEVAGSADLRKKFQILVGSIVRIGTYEGSITSVAAFGQDALTLGISPNFVVGVGDSYYTGFPIEIVGPYSHRWTFATSPAADGADTFTPTTQFKEIGSGKEWATGILLRFVEPHDDLRDPNYNSEAFSVGDRIVITSEGLVLKEQPAAKITRTSLDAAQNRDRKPWRDTQGPVTVRRGTALADVIQDAEFRPRFHFGADCAGLLPFLDPFDVVRIIDPDTIPVELNASNQMDCTITSVEHDLLGSETDLVLLGAQHE